MSTVGTHSGTGPLSLMSCVRESSPLQDYEVEKNGKWCDSMSELVWLISAFLGPYASIPQSFYMKEASRGRECDRPSACLFIMPGNAPILFSQTRFCTCLTEMPECLLTIIRSVALFSHNITHCKIFLDKFEKRRKLGQRGL